MHSMVGNEKSVEAAIVHRHTFDTKIPFLAAENELICHVKY